MSGTLFTDGITTDQVRRILRLEPSGSRSRADGPSMYDKQVQGIATLYNLLAEQPVAYLADEVGMGKTYQALGLACLLWNLEPSARVMVVAPRGNIQRKWAGDYYTFLRNNYQHWDDRVVDGLLGRPVRPPVVCENLTHLVSELVRDAERFFLLRLTSFMRPVIFPTRQNQRLAGTVINAKAEDFGHLHFYPRGMVPDRLRRTRVADERARAACMAWTGAAVNQALPDIDLLIVDEAQCLRHRENQSCTNFRRAFGLYASDEERQDELLQYLDLRTYKGSEPRPRVRRLLLMSATPAHSRVEDIGAQLRYGVGLEHGESLREVITELEASRADVHRAQKALEKVMVRRFRMFGPLNKYGYRQEQAPRMRVEDDPLAELSTALVTKQLYRVLEGQGNRFRVGFLSSFESLQQSVTRNRQAGDDSTEEQASHVDESGRAPDDGFIRQLDDAFLAEFGTHLVHPKQRFIIEEARRTLDPEETPEIVKMLVFVRRLATVGELVREISAAYDKILERKLSTLFDIPQDDVSPQKLKARLRELRTTQEDPPDSEDGELEDDNDDVPEQTSQYLELFRPRGSAGQWFRALFRQGRALWWFFEENWVRTLWWLETAGAIPLVEYLRDRGVNISEPRASYPARHEGFLNAQLRFVSDNARPSVLQFLRRRHTRYVAGADQLGAEDTDGRLLLRTSFWNELQEQGEIDWASFLRLSNSSDEGELYRREQTKAWISKNLRMSEPIIDLAAAYREARSDREAMVQRFVQLVRQQPKLQRRLALLVEHAPLIDRTLGYDQQADRYDRLDGWSLFDDQMPVRGVLGGSGTRDVTTRQFNTPFFPDIIVCTDVLREGVDLHLFCDRVVHYGLAFSPGDLEQRTGRVDRYFSQAYRNIEGSPDHRGELHIAYPYVESTLDELQLARVLARRKEVQGLMDRGLPVPRFDADISVRDKADPVVSLLLHPTREARTDPFGASDGYGSTVAVVDLDRKWHDIARDHLKRLLEDLRAQFMLHGRVDTYLDGALDHRLFRLTVGLIGKRGKKRLAQPGEEPDRLQSVQVSLDFASAYRTHVLKAKSWITDETKGKAAIDGWLEGIEDVREVPYAVGVAVMLEHRKTSKREVLNALVSEASIPFTQANGASTVDAEELADLISRVACTADHYEEALLGEDRAVESKWR